MLFCDKEDALFWSQHSNDDESDDEDANTKEDATTRGYFISSCTLYNGYVVI